MHDLGEKHAVVTGEPAASKGCTAGSGRGPLEKDPHSGNLASGLPVLRYGTEPGDFVALAVVVGAGRLRIEVHDPVRKHPRLRPESDERQRGRGLLIVDRLAKWGVDERPFGKVVWADMSW
ncbi:ATP-binding protein [Streptomyces sp. bgisy100]|uniref:ATP-binding protein n=1 Tax=Streptomyces sp. bgisy100 TaxID=3413783 RepID=UPI003D73AFDD